MWLLTLMRKPWKWTEAQRRTVHARHCYVCLRRDNTSGFRGVTRYGNKWVANCADKYLGLFATPEAAALAYDLAATIKFGQFAHNNFAVSTGKLEKKQVKTKKEK